MSKQYWIDDILNVDKPNTKIAYIYEQDIEKFNSKAIHVIEYSEYAKLKQACEVMREALEKSIKLCDDPISTGDVHTAWHLIYGTLEKVKEVLK